MPSPMGSAVESDKKATGLCGSLLIAVAGLFLVPQVRAQANSSAPSSNSSPSPIPAMRSENGFTWIEQFDGSANTEGQVMLLDSSVGYLFGRHLLVDAGVPVYFVRANATAGSGASTTNSFTELGDVYGQVRLSFPNPALNFKTQLTGRAPTGSTSEGISTGHATYDWTNRIETGRQRVRLVTYRLTAYLQVPLFSRGSCPGKSGTSFLLARYSFNPLALLHFGDRRIKH
jgi:hypothetical protein